MSKLLEKIRLSLLPHKKPVAYAIMAFLILFFFWTCAPRASAAEVSVNAGARVLRGEAASLHINYTFAEFAPGIRPVVGMGLLGASNDPDWGPDENNGFAYVGMKSCRWHVCLTLGGAGLMRETQYSGTQAQFMLAVTGRVLRGDGWALDAGWYHFSNSGIRKPNPGFDIPGIGFVRIW